jgi:hypothetical protein
VLQFKAQAWNGCAQMIVNANMTSLPHFVHHLLALTGNALTSQVN